MAKTPMKRSILQHLMWCQHTVSTPGYYLINEGVSDLTEEFEPDEETLQYVAEDAKTSFVKSYAMSVGLTVNLVDNDPVCKEILWYVKHLKTGSEADAKYVRFMLTDKIDDNTYTGYEVDANVSVSNIGGSAEDYLSTEATLNGKGSPKEVTVTKNTDGTFNVGTATPTCEFTFKVQDSSGAAISDAVVLVDGMDSKSTTSSGTASFKLQTSATYKYSVSATGKTPSAGSLTTTTQATQELTVTLAT